MLDANVNFPSQEAIENELIQFFNNIEIEENDLVKYICLELSKGSSVASVTASIPLSIRVIQKKFKTIVGMSMRHYSYNVRQRKLWIDLLNEENDKLHTILNHGYYDQAHFINTFKKKMQRSHINFESYLKKIQISVIEN
ncbi:MAG: helix-turn-helix domain-containing protein [Kordia sp.]|uniref:helix-turn-helix domain-containing protein n=1 Tax=Kordia sp. TaxID=1965332 RepID=UPI00385B4B69